MAIYCCHCQDFAFRLCKFTMFRGSCSDFFPLSTVWFQEIYKRHSTGDLVNWVRLQSHACAELTTSVYARLMPVTG